MMVMLILVLIEMFNVLNLLSENKLLFFYSSTMNVWLFVFIVISMWFYFIIMYVLFFVKMFIIIVFNYEEWCVVFWFFIFVIFIDEVLKYVTRAYRVFINLWFKCGWGDIFLCFCVVKGFWILNDFEF